MRRQKWNLSRYVDLVFNSAHYDKWTEKATFCIPQTSSTSNFFWTRKLSSILLIERKFQQTLPQYIGHIDALASNAFAVW